MKVGNLFVYFDVAIFVTLCYFLCNVDEFF